MAVYKGVLSFPKLFTPESGNPSMAPRYGTVVLLPPNDPQIAAIQQEIHTAKLNHWPTGNFPQVRECLQQYDHMFAGKEYYDPKFSGFWVLSANSSADSKPAVVDLNRQPIIDASQVFAGCVAYVSVNILVYTTGSTGVGAFLNGVMVSNEEPPYGRLDGKPSVEQMFQGVQDLAPAAPLQAPVAQAPAAPMQAPVAQAPVAQAPAAPMQAPVAPVAPVAQAPAPAPAAGRQMTASATATYEAYKAAGWSDEALIQNGLMLPPAAAPSFQ